MNNNIKNPGASETFLNYYLLLGNKILNLFYNTEHFVLSTVSKRKSQRGKM